MRTSTIVGNWKEGPAGSETALKASELAEGLVRELPQIPEGHRVIVCPPAVFLERVARVLQRSGIKVGAQSVSQYPGGAFTGEISADMFKSAGAEFALAGHSERRIMGETNEMTRVKVRAILEAALSPVLCVGETLEERDAGRAEEVVGRQVMDALGTLSEAQMRKVMIAYEPRWSIGTGEPATPEDANSMHGYIRGLIEEWFKKPIAGGMGIYYGGSVKGDNAAGFMQQEHVDGLLVGGESLKAPNFAQIVKYGQQTAA